MPALLSFDSSTEHLSVALQLGAAVHGGAAQERVWSHDGPGGAHASVALIPAVFRLLAEAGLTLRELDAIAFGRGPGAFTGLRTACAAAQGLALGAGLPVLPVDSLLAVAEQARAAGAETPLWVVMDARMNEIYAAQYTVEGSIWRVLAAPMLTSPEALNARWQAELPRALAGSAIAAFGERLQVGSATCFPDALPCARAMLPLAAAMWARGEAVDAAQALPLYLRDKVAQTTAERAAAKAAA